MVKFYGKLNGLGSLQDRFCDCDRHFALMSASLALSKWQQLGWEED